VRAGLLDGAGMIDGDDVPRIVARDARLYGAGFTYHGQRLAPVDVVVYLPSRAILVPQGTPDSVLDAIEHLLEPYRELPRHD
jgi:hypothetical protein